jgi:ABC-2 type transport system permease protein
VRTLAVALDLLREARARRWVHALTGAVTLFLLAIALGLRLEVVDGALAGWRFFGDLVNPEIRAADVALRPLFAGVAYLVFWSGLAFGVLACADYAPALLAPGRIEHLLSLPVRRAELVAGTFLGVLALVFVGALYGGGGLSLIVFAKTGIFGWAPVLAAALGAAAFAPIYAVMVLAAVAIRSAALSAATGGLVYLMGIVASHRRTLAPLFEDGLARRAFLASTAPLPRLADLASAAAGVGEGKGLDLLRLLAHLGGLSLFALAALALCVAILERKDF